MATNNRGNNNGGNRGGNRGRTGRNNNPEGNNQYDRGWTDSARDRPFTAAAAVGGVVAAGVFLWSRRNQITDQISGLSDQINEWREGSESGNEQSFMASSGRGGSSKSQSDIAEEALTLKETGRKAKRPKDPMIDEQIKTGSVAY
jgi:hypothetical protein